MDHGNVDFCLYSLLVLCLTLKCLSWHFLCNFTKIFPCSCDKWDFHLSPLNFLDYWMASICANTNSFSIPLKRDI